MRFALVLKLTVLGVTASLLGCDSSDTVDAVSNVETLEEADTVYLNGNIIDSTNRFAGKNHGAGFC
jgi:hypothetical protein